VSLYNVRVVNVQSIKCVACAEVVVSVCSVEGYSSVMWWMVVEVVYAGSDWKI